MKNFINFFRMIFRVQYRLSVLYRGETEFRHIYAAKSAMLKRMARSLSDVQYWSLYKEGPFGLPERKVDFGINQLSDLLNKTV